MRESIKVIINEIENIIEGKKISEIINFEKDNIYNKSASSLIIKNYINKHSSYNLDTLLRYKIKLKFIPVNQDYKSYEAMSFSHTSLYDIMFEAWDSEDDFEISTLKKQLDFIFLFIPIIKKKSKGVFNNNLEWQVGEFSYWIPSEGDLNNIGAEWSGVNLVLKNGVELKKVKHGKSYRTTNNLPKQSETSFIHLRPHGKNSFDYDLQYLEYTDGNIEITKQSFWINKKFINKLLEKNKWKTNLKEE